MNNFKAEITLSALDYKQKRMMAILDPTWPVDVVRLPAQRPVLRFGTGQLSPLWTLLGS